MSQENVELTYRAADAFNRRDLNAFLALADPDAEFTSRIVEVESGASPRGHDGVRRWWKDIFDVFPDFRSEIEEIRDLETRRWRGCANTVKASIATHPSS